MKCRSCGQELEDTFLDLGSAPPSNAFLHAKDLRAPERWFPLRLLACSSCRLVQTEVFDGGPDLFDENYPYFSSYSTSWLEHAHRFVQAARSRLCLDRTSFVVEVASNDGYLLQYVKQAGIPCLGIEPTVSTAKASIDRGIETWIEFFGAKLARRLVAERGKVDLMIANNVLAHVPDLNDFVAGIAIALADEGVASIEFPHLQNLVEQRQFDTVYHEHYSYFSLHAVRSLCARHQLKVCDATRLPTHGGSLRIWLAGVHSARTATCEVAAILEGEVAAGMLSGDYYQGFQSKADEVKNGLLEFLLKAKQEGLRIAGYGAAAKGNTLLNYAGVRPDLIPYVVDASPHKIGMFLPGSRIPVREEAFLKAEEPDLVLILPWNLRTEIMQQLSYVRSWGGRFVFAVPRIEVV